MLTSGNSNTNRRSVAGRGFYFRLAIKEFSPVNNIIEAKSFFCGRGVKASAIIRNNQLQLTSFRSQPDQDSAGMGVFNNVIDLLLDDAKQHKFSIMF